MDEVFKALADSSRRQLLDSLNTRNGQSLRELCAELDMARQSVSKHLAVLEVAGLVTTVWHGRQKLHYLNPVPIHQIAERWISRYERGRMAALAHLKHSLEGTVMSKPEFVYVTYIQTTAEELYQALTDPEFIKVYMGNTGPRSDWQVGSPVLWKSQPDGEFEDLGQRVLEAEPGKRLSYTWHTLQPMHRELFDSEEEFEEACKERSRVTFDIEPAEVPELGVKLTITHDGFDSPDSKMLESVSGGWVMILSGLKTVLEGGKWLSERQGVER
ncbi:metalloregulator ArsR/SmtB family transcription factor [Haloechinothrix sp. YIM 98757]|uniref:Metalloregulator ArsR/SmtB family transcription factor n=1 Tax=Haloechinothrix aidingensis TaxID=2752311 RepID=A0A838A9Y3_9PSEU|nr:metalloregulator ArsR/SmtB family transcription factor [Haloechinothrix aidingensis]MBA0126117.1 metalloregulator ArsR/SmtB family transcription factor [Haloechinothrix aidingensis]